MRDAWAVDFTAGWQAILSAGIAVAGIAGTTVTGITTTRAADRRAQVERASTEKLAIQARDQDRQDAAVDHERIVQDHQRRERRDVLQALLRRAQPFVKGASLEWQRLGSDEKATWIEDRVSEILTLAYESGDEAIIGEAEAICDNNAGKLDDTRSAARALAKRCGSLLNE